MVLHCPGNVCGWKKTMKRMKPMVSLWAVGPPAGRSFRATLEHLPAFQGLPLVLPLLLAVTLSRSQMTAPHSSEQRRCSFPVLAKYLHVQFVSRLAKGNSLSPPRLFAALLRPDTACVLGGGGVLRRAGRFTHAPASRQVQRWW